MGIDWLAGDGLILSLLSAGVSGTKADGKGSEEKKDRACDDQPVGVTEVGRAAVVCGVDAVPGNYEEYAVDNEGDKADQECEESKEGSADVSNSRSTEAHEDGEEREASSDRVEYQSVGQAMCDCSANVSDISAEGLQSLICAVSKGRSAALSKSIDARDGVAPLAQSKLGSAHTGGQEPDGVPDGVAHADHNKKYEGAESEEDAWTLSENRHLAARTCKLLLLFAVAR